jgi:DMSO/TMAO reductase YedYZ molybdopterin-dependent catalytic subunit
MSTQTMSVGRAARSTPSSRGADVAAFVAGAIAALVAIAVGELAAGLVAGAPSLVVSIADLIVDLQPPGAKQLMVDLFGDADKQVVNGMIIGSAVLIAGLLGVAGRRSFNAAVAGFGIAGFVALIAATRQPLNDTVLALVTVVLAVAAALVVLRALLSLCAPAWAASRSASTPDGTVASMPDWDRRRFLIRGGAVTASAVAAGVVGRSLLESGSAAPVTALPDPGTGAGGESLPGIITVPPGAELEVEGITPIVVPNDRFYRIDTAFVVPRVDPRTWTLTIKGMVDTETVLTLDDLAAMPQVEQYVTIACVSNEVGGRYVGNALWKGVDLRSVLARAGVQEGATQIVGRSVDDFTAGFPTAWAMDPLRTPMIALQMNGVPLPTDHGYPARLIIPGLYGYVSATKWLKEIEITTLEAFDGYWIPLGWAKEAPILTQSRIDVPRNGATVTPGTNAVAGVAWAPDRGISAVEVRIDEGEWQHAELSDPLAPAAWVQWKLAWDATPGSHRIEVRATDGEGVVQTDERTPPAPDGARGHHRISVTVA